uniref:Bifunctional epoxide hydrolase 2 n=1 Tax=Sphaerodactylus townsendi TaxID=933632 RepID=A0ACB8G8Y5_9SAUR
MFYPPQERRAILYYSFSTTVCGLLLDYGIVGISQAVFIGHDWGGATVWNMALFYPERVRAVASLNTPFKPADPTVDIMELIKAIPVFDYQLYFQEQVSIQSQ